MSVEQLAPYAPMEARQALATGQALPERRQGAALFADISGFTPLTEALARELGPQRGAEELAHHLNRVYDALIDTLHAYRGSVVGFSGDAITCWLDGDDGARAVACGLAMQAAMTNLGPAATPNGTALVLALKVAVATGAARYFVVGDPQIQQIGTLAGGTLQRLAQAEHEAGIGEVVVDEATAHALGARLEVAAWRQAADTEARVAVVATLLAPPPRTPWPVLPPDLLGEQVLRPWLLPAVDARLRAGNGEFLAELRPAVALFLRFSGIDYEGDAAAGEQLTAYVRWVQAVLNRYEGTLIQFTIGDKGSYLYAAFGAPKAHEDDAARALAAALDLHQPPSAFAIGPVQIGVSQGRMRTGAYGAHSQRTYGVLGDEVNVAARLMSAAAPGQIIVSQRARASAGPGYLWEALPPLRVKGKQEPLIVFRLLGAGAIGQARLHEPRYALPMVGRTAELALADDRLGEAMAGRGQILALVAEAGMGKSRLVAEIIQLARGHEVASVGGECSSYGLNSPYLPWQSVWCALFRLDDSATLEGQIEDLTRAVDQINPELVPRVPLLGAVLGLPIPDNEVTAGLDAKLRRTALDSLLLDCLRDFARRPLLIALEDCHWMDPLSHELLETLGRAIARLPVCIVLSYRPPEESRLAAPRVSLLPNFAEINLHALGPDEARQLIDMKVRHLYDSAAELPASLTDELLRRTQGNPFYLEELLAYLRDQGLDVRDRDIVSRLEWPTSLHSLILSRVDQLDERQRTTLKVASIIGRRVPAALLSGAYASLGSPAEIVADLTELSRLDLMPLDSPEPDLAHIFKHVVTQEVAYDSLPFATRARLHEQVAHYIEHTGEATLESQLDLLAFHFGRSENAAKQREFFLKAGAAAQAAYANSSAIEYFRRALTVLAGVEAVEARLRLGQVLELVGQWDDALALYQQALDATQALREPDGQARCELAIGDLRRKRGAYPEAANWLEASRRGFETIGNEAGVGQVQHLLGTLAAQQGDYAAARAHYEASLIIRRHLEDHPRIAALLSNLGIIARMEGDNDAAQALHEEALAIRREVGDRWAVANSLNNLGNVLLDRERHAEARTLLEEALALQREVGDRWAIANSLNNLGNVAATQGDRVTAQILYAESLTINRELGDRRALAYLLEDVAKLLAPGGDASMVVHLSGAAAAIRATIGAPLSATEQAKLDQALAPALDRLGDGATPVWEEGHVAPLDALLDALAAQL